MSMYSIDGQTMSGIADAVREMRYEKGTMSPAQIEAKIRSTTLGEPITVPDHIDPQTGVWVRPVEYPNLDSITIPSDFDGIYMTYDLRKTPGYGWIGVYVQNATNGTSFWVERGHLESGVFIVDEAYEQISSSSSAGTSTRFFRLDLDETNGSVQLWRVRSESHILRFGFATSATTTAKSYLNYTQPCVEAIGNLPYVNSLGSTASTNPAYLTWGTSWLERDARVPGKLSCVTTMNSCWVNCFSLQELDLSQWDTSGWRVNTLANCWIGCRSLRHLDLSSLNTSGWTVSSLASTWAACFSLRSLDLSGWDTSGWTVTSLASTWNGCRALVRLDVSTWDTGNWTVTTLANCWNSCHSLCELDVSGWKTANWAVGALNSTWSNCRFLKVLDLSSWDVSNWIVNTLYCTWSACYSLRSLDVSTWDTRNWAVTTMESTFAYNYCIGSHDLTNWDTSNWAVTTICNVFRENCVCREIDISTWDVNGWSVTDSKNAFMDCRMLSSFLLPAGLSVNTANGTGTPSESVLLVYYNGYEMFYNHTYANCYSLSHTSLVHILANLGTVSAARTITLGQQNKLKLTSEEIAVATQKGWTVA